MLSSDLMPLVCNYLSDNHKIEFFKNILNTDSPWLNIRIRLNNKYKIDELKNEIKVYYWLQKAGVNFIPNFVFGSVAFIFYSVATEIIDGKS